MSAPRLETVGASNWREFVQAPVAVLVLAKSDCDACRSYGDELVEWLADAIVWPDVRFGKMILDAGGLVDFKRASPWLAELDTLPFTQIYVGGERWKAFAGGGVARLESRLRGLPTSR